MRKPIILMAAALTAATAMAQRENPLYKPFTGQYEIAPYAEIQYEDYMPALREAVKINLAEIEAIANNPAEPTFENTILAMEESGEMLNRVVGVFANLDEAVHTPEMEAIGEEFYPILSKHSDATMMNDALFQRVKKLYDNRLTQNYTTAQRRDIEETYKQFTRQGALLNADQKAQLSDLNSELTDLYQQYNRNLLNATNDFAIIVDDAAQLAGIPASVVAVAADEAKSRGLDGKWVFTLHAPVRLPVLQYAQNRDIRRQMYQGYINQASSGKYNNAPVINKILRARTAKAKLLGYPDFASYQTENVMAKTPQAAEALLMKIWRPAVERAQEEVAQMQEYIDAEGGNFKLEPWDYYYYSEKVRQQKYDFDENEVRPYFSVDSVRKGIFDMAGTLYGIKFVPMPDAPKYHPDVEVFDVVDANTGEHISVFMTDYFTRSTKRQGAWMGEIKSSWVERDGTPSRPIIYNVCNFAKPTADSPSLLSLDDVETMFHEFGHGLHGMLSRAQYRSQSGTNVDRDFVELPSQIHEHWATNPELLKRYAHHYQTGEVIPDALVEKMLAAANYGQGFTTTELVGAALLDLKWGAQNVGANDSIDVFAFEANVAQELGMPREIQFRYRSPYFKHVFGSDHYASGYYTYLWAEVLDSDGFELFQEKGIFDPATARSFRENVLEKGGSEDPMVLYITFRGHEPDPDALLRNRGLAPATEAAEKPAIDTTKK